MRIPKTFFSLAALVGLASPTVAAGKPNIVVILVDDFGYECIAANGGESYQTPNMDKLAATGTRFEQCYVQPVCTPTRVQLMTGISNIRNYFSFGRIDRDATTFAHLFKQAGYATGIAGKWQLGRGKKLPQHLGFDEAVLWQHTRRPPRYANPGLEYNGEERDFTNGEYGPDLINDFALDFITRHKDGPFLLYYTMMLTHEPYEPTPDSKDYDRHAQGEKLNDPKYFADDVAYADKLVGTMIAKLDELKIRDNTLVILLGDNGTGVAVTSKFKGQDYRGGKGRTTANGMRVPLIANWPGKVPTGAVNQDLISSTDFLTTLCDVAGIKPPASLPPDGQSFYPQLMGKVGTPREWFYCWFGNGPGLETVRQFAMTKEYKLYIGGRFFELAADPLEEHPQDVAALTGKAAEAAKTLRGVLDMYADARPPEVVAATKAAAKSPEGQAKLKRKNRRRAQRQQATQDASK